MSKSKEVFARLQKKGEDELNKRYRALSLQLLGLIIGKTPVVTGTLMANWDLSLNYAARKRFSSSRNAYSEGAKNAKRAKLSDAIFIVNNMPYAAVIEYGIGKGRYPVGMLRRSVKQIERALK